MNTFGYVSGNPVNKIDPLGLVESCTPGLFGLALCHDPVNPPPPGSIPLIPPVTVPPITTPGTDSSSISTPPYRSSEADDDDREERCDNQYYNVDIPVCRGIKRNRGDEAAERCYATAAQRYAACLRGRPLPPLDTYNN